MAFPFGIASNTKITQVTFKKQLIKIKTKIILKFEAKINIDVCAFLTYFQKINNKNKN